MDTWRHDDVAALAPHIDTTCDAAYAVANDPISGYLVEQV
jgi:hypothetical protein